MTDSVKKTSSHDATEMVEVQGSTEAEASSLRPRKRSRKAKDVEASSDQTQKRGPKIKLPPGEKEARKRERDRNRYKTMKDAVQETREMKPQLETLKNEKAGWDGQLGKLTQDMKTLKEDLEIVKNDYKEKESLVYKFVQNKLTEDDLKNMEIPLNYDCLDGKENRSSEGISNGENLKPDSEYPLELFDLVGMSRQEILPELQKIWGSFEELKREKEELKRENEELKGEIEEWKREKEGINSRVTEIETMIRAMIPKK